MSVHPDKTAIRAVDACGGTYTAAEMHSRFAEGHSAALCEAMKAVVDADALTAELLAALQSADHALAQVTAFECDAREIMGNTNFEIVKHERERVKAAIAKATGAA